MPERIDDLLQRRAALVTEQRRLLDSAEGEDRTLNAEESQTYERVGSDLDELETRIERLRDSRERARSLAAAEHGSGEGNFDPRRASGEASEGSEENRAYLAAFESYIRRGMVEMTPEEIRTLRAGFSRDETRVGQNVGTNADGGYTVPQGFYGRLVEFLTESAAMRRAGATVVETASGNDLPIPKVSAHGSAAWIAEAASITESDETFAQAILEAFKAARLVKVSVELLEDSGVDIEGYLARELGRSIGELEGAAYAVGDGSSKPEGLFPNATVGVTLATGSTTTIPDGDVFIDLVHSITEPYRAGAKWMMGDSLVKQARKLKDTNDAYIFQTSLRDGEPDTLLGYPIVTDHNVATPAADAIVAAFGRFDLGYFIRDVKAVRIFRLNERYMDNGQVGFIGWHRTDGAVIDANAVKTMKMAAS